MLGLFQTPGHSGGEAGRVSIVTQPIAWLLCDISRIPFPDLLALPASLWAAVSLGGAVPPYKSDPPGGPSLVSWTESGRRRGCRQRAELLGHGKGCRFDSENNGQPTKGFKQGSNMIQFKF